MLSIQQLKLAQRCNRYSFPLLHFLSIGPLLGLVRNTAPRGGWCCSPTAIHHRFSLKVEYPHCEVESRGAASYRRACESSSQITERSCISDMRGAADANIICRSALFLSCFCFFFRVRSLCSAWRLLEYPRYAQILLGSRLH